MRFTATLVVLLWATATRASNLRAFELDVFAGFSGRLYPSESEPGIVASRNGGFGGAVSFAYRAPFFVHPFLDVGWSSISSSDRVVDLGAQGGVAVASRSLSTWTFMIGPGMEVWQLRLRAGLGVYDLLVRTDLLGVTSRSSAIQFGYLVSLAWIGLRAPPFQLGAEARLSFVTGVALVGSTNIGLFAVGLTGAWDFVTWER